MTIICLEGASGVGKSTTSSILEYEFGFEVIPEVNFLFKRSANESDTWYFEKQIERWKLAENIFLNGRVAVLDGDIMQPLWYNWIFDDLGFQAIDQVIEYYSKAIKNRIIKFPDKYFILKASVNELRTRKENDRTRTRKNFETHLKLVQPQLEYFAAMELACSGSCQVLNTNVDSPKTLAKIIASNLPNDDKLLDSESLFNNLCKFLQSKCHT